jgi:hypothetical protein
MRAMTTARSKEAETRHQDGEHWHHHEHRHQRTYKHARPSQQVQKIFARGLQTKPEQSEHNARFEG